MRMRIQQVAKRAVDVAASAVALIILSPVLALVAAAIRLTSPGPVLFRQRRLGWNGVPFEIFKFRTMVANAAQLRNADGSAFSGERDPRVTPIGKLLRASSLDELPQLVNVLRGEMSLVGPRPDQVDQLRYYREGEFRKLAARPGITGLAQIRGRNRISWEARKQLDVEYIERWSFGLDCRLLAETVPYVLLGRDVNQN